MSFIAHGFAHSGEKGGRPSPWVRWQMCGSQRFGDPLPRFSLVLFGEASGWDDVTFPGSGEEVFLLKGFQCAENLLIANAPITWQPARFLTKLQDSARSQPEG